MNAASLHSLAHELIGKSADKLRHFLRHSFSIFNALGAQLG